MNTETYIQPPRTGMEAFELMPEGTLCQLINDVLVMSPALSPSHQDILDKIFYELKAFVLQHKLGKAFFSPIDVYLNDKNVYQPDIIFVSNEKLHAIDWNKGIIGAPDLIIEVLSKSNRKYDMNDKMQVYEKEGVQEYWVVDYRTKWCKGFTNYKNSFEDICESNAEIKFKLFDLTINLADKFSYQPFCF